MTALSAIRPIHLLLSAVLCVALLAVATPAVQAQVPLTVHRHAGETRTQTAAAVAAVSHPDGADTVVLARADAYGDALVAAPLAAALDAPVLLTGPDALDPAAAEALDRLDAREVTAVGALSPAVLDALAPRDVDRIVGPDDWSTWAAVAAEVIALTDASEGLLVEGVHSDPQRGWPDALTASAWAAREQIPVLMTSAESLPPATAAVLSRLDDVTLVGGTAAVSDVVAGVVGGLLGGTPERVAGDGRYDTAVAVARRGLDAGGYVGSVWIASGRAWPDALVAGPAAARDGGVLVLSDPTSMQHSPATRAFLDDQRGYASDAHLVGGTAALGDAVAHTVRTGELPEAADPGRPVLGDRPAPVPARNPAPPIAGALPWSDPATWGGRVPQAGEEVVIPADRAVLLDVDPPPLAGIRVEGTLVAADIDMTIEVGYVLVVGRLALGTEAQPLTRRVTVVLDPRPGADVAGAGEGPIAVQGGTLDLHGTTPAQTWTRLAATAPAGSTSLQLQDAPGWRVGDTVVVASTSTDFEQAEERTVTAITGTGVQLDRPLTHTHWGQVDVLGGTEIAQQAEVGSLSRNLVITSSEAAKAAQRGGHVQVFAGSLARISGTELHGMGQAGELARYPIHFHMMGSASGSYVRGASIHHTFNRCLTIHATDHVDVEDTIGYESRGHCFFFEDGVEVGNALHCNLGLSTRVPDEGRILLESDRTPATFWISNPANHFTENAAAGSASHGFWFDLPEAPTGMSAGAPMDVRRMPLGTFDRNVAHSGSDPDWKESVGIFVEDHHPPTTAVMRDNHAWANASFGAWVEGVEMHGGTLSGNGIGFLGRRSALRDATVVGTTTNDPGGHLWRQTGVGFYHEANDVEDVTFVNFAQERHSWQVERVALEAIADELVVASRVSGASFVNARRLRMEHPQQQAGREQMGAVLRDVDGSISGAPALLSSGHPLVHDGACPRREDLRANVCPAGYDRVWLRIDDPGGGLGPVTVTRDDGGAARLDGPMWAPQEASGDVLIDRRYTVSSPSPHSGHLQVVVHGDVEGFVDLSVPWPYPTAHVYDGWGRWHPVAQGSPADGGWQLQGGVLTVRHRLDDIAEDGTWQHMELCAQAYCGNPGPG